jgi:predicted membrane channel-forming protein YqfA (hemolysin III family)
MAFEFAFKSTHQDLLDSYEAYRTARTGVRAWVRGVIILFGFAWLLAVVVVLTSGKPLDTWQSFAWVGVGVLIVFQFLVKPELAKRRILRSNPPAQEVGLTFTDAGIGVLVVGVISYQRSWSEIAEFINASKGIVMTFSDGSAYWIPLRVFKNPQERAALVNFVQERMPTHDRRAA